MKKRKGMMAMNMLITIILLVIGFAIVFYFFIMFDWTGNVNKEVCHQSVIYRATLPSIAGAKEYVPLKCKTDKICITSGLIGGSCKEFEGLEGVTKIKVRDTKEIEQILAREIIDCWKMMGEGKVQVFSQFMAEKFAIGSIGSSCVICNRVAFDSASLEKARIDLSKINIMEYMQTHAISDQDISYYSYLAGEGGKISVKDDVQIIGIENTEIDPKTGKITLNTKEVNVPLEEFTNKADNENKELAIMFMQITAPTTTGVISNTLKATGIGIGLSFLATPNLATSAVGVAASSWSITLVLGAILGIYQHGNVAYNRAITAGYCGDISTGDDARDGCSVVRTINYNEEDISQYCSVIESIS
jgi:hypothetical protein